MEKNDFSSLKHILKHIFFINDYFRIQWRKSNILTYEKIKDLDLYQNWLDFKIHYCSNISKRKMNVYRLKTETFKKTSNTLGFHALYHVIRPDIMVLSELNKLY